MIKTQTILEQRCDTETRTASKRSCSRNSDHISCRVTLRTIVAVIGDKLISTLRELSLLCFRIIPSRCCCWQTLAAVFSLKIFILRTIQPFAASYGDNLLKELLKNCRCILKHSSRRFPVQTWSWSPRRNINVNIDVNRQHCLTGHTERKVRVRVDLSLVIDLYCLRACAS